LVLERYVPGVGRPVETRDVVGSGKEPTHRPPAAGNRLGRNQPEIVTPGVFVKNSPIPLLSSGLLLRIRSFQARQGELVAIWREAVPGESSLPVCERFCFAPVDGNAPEVVCPRPAGQKIDEAAVGREGKGTDSPVIAEEQSAPGAINPQEKELREPLALFGFEEGADLRVSD
jgi:hypothetical protein